MSANLAIDNFSPNNIKEESTLAADVAVGATTITPENIQGYANGDLLLISRPGTETCEKRQITISGSDITVSALSYPHRKYARLTSLYGDQIKIYRAANSNGYQPDDSAFAPVDNGTISIEVDQNTTSFTDPTGSRNYWYKYTYLNSVSLSETNLADAIAVRGGGYGHYATIDQIKRAAGFGNNTWITDAQIDEQRVAAEDEINSELGIMYVTPFSDPVPAVINNITRLLAAGYLLTESGGPFSLPLQKEGEAKIALAQTRIAEIKTGQITLQDAAGQSMKQTSGVDFSPALTTEDDDFLFKISDQF